MRGIQAHGFGARNVVGQHGAEQDRRAEESIARDIAEQRAKGLYSDVDESVPVEERIARLRAKLHQRLAGKSGDRPAG